MNLINFSKKIRTIISGLITIIGLTATASACSESEIEKFDNSNANKLYNQLINNGTQTTRKFYLNKNFQLSAELQATSKGNGTLKIHNLYLRIFDQHDDGIIYENNLLNIDLKDLNGNGYNELIISGVLKHTGEKETDSASYSPFTQIFTYDCKIGLFTQLYKLGDYSIELPVEKIKSRKCDY
ncbi:MAG: hypothetical protein QM500_01110 [Methylococcales bacterium]